MSGKPPPNPALLDLFRAELETHLATLNEGLLSLEKQPDQPKRYESLMRAAHSIKGAAKIVGIDEAARLAHQMEDYFVAAQNGQIKIASDAVDVLLGCVDALSRMGAVDDPTAMPPQEEVERLIERISAARTGKAPPQKPIAPQRDIVIPNADKPASTMDEFVAEAKEHLAGMVQDLLALEQGKEPADGQRIDRMFRAVHSVKGGAGFNGFQTIESLAHAMENVFEDLRRQETTKPGESVVDCLLACADRVASLLDDVQRSNEADVSDLIERLQSCIVASAAENETKSTDKTPSAATRADPAMSDVQPKPSDKSGSVRIPVPLVDRLMTLAGELVLARNQALRALDGGMSALQPVLKRLDGVTSQLQSAVTETRMQPVGNLFAKFPRVVRDLARQLGKSIELELAGTEVELDKSVLELLSDPLTHLVRNCCDHGIESPDERRRSGKPPAGRIHLSASQLGGQICIEVRDDGRGLDARRIKNKALQAGLRTAAELDRLGEKDLLDLILLPGFSTAAGVTDLSGRGVGMDVVKTNVDQLGGALEIDSTFGQGTSFSLRVPLTLAIIPCLVVSAGGQRYAIPQKDLEELICIDPSQSQARIERALDQEVIRRRGRLLPLVRLTELLVLCQPWFDGLGATASLPSSAGNTVGQANRGTRQSMIERALGGAADRAPLSGMETEDGNTCRPNLIAVLKAGSRRFALLVDDIVRSEEIVVKPVHGAMKALACFSGTTIMGDGRVALILNIEGIAQRAGVRFAASVEQDVATNDKMQVAGSEVLLFNNGPDECFAIPLAMLRRLMLAEKSRVERVGSREFIAIDGQSTPIVRLDEILPVSAGVDADPFFLLLPKNVSRPLAFAASSIIDTARLPAEMTLGSFEADGVVGTATIGDRMTLLLDANRLADIAISAGRVQPPAPPKRRGKRILVVEDTQFFRELVRGHLQEEGYEVATADNGAEAVAALDRGGFDLVVSDIEMPVMDGWTFARAVRENPRHGKTPLLALTTLNSEADRRRAKTCGFNGYLVKLQRQELIDAVAELLLESATAND
jgi:two-component system, chemotaxis family, sensor kinase CheA